MGESITLNIFFAYIRSMQKLLLLITLVPFLSFGQTEVGIKVGPSYTVSTGNLKSDFGKGKVRYHAGVYTRETKGKVNLLFEAFYKNRRDFSN